MSDKKELFIKREILFANEKLLVKPIQSGKTKLFVKLELVNFPYKKLIQIYRKIFIKKESL